MQVQISLFDDNKKVESVCYPAENKEFYDILLENADLLRCKEKISWPEEIENSGFPYYLRK